MVITLILNAFSNDLTIKTIIF